MRSSIAPRSPCSIAIPAVDEARALDELLPLLARQSADVVGEIVVCDNGSSDETAAVVERWVRACSRIRLITEPRPGKPAAWNALIRAVQHDLVIFLDADCTPAPDTLSRLWGAACQSSHLAYTGRRQFTHRPEGFAPRLIAWIGDPVLELCLAGNVYAIRRDAVQRRLAQLGFDEMPDVFAEDIWLQSTLQQHELLRVDAPVRITMDTLSAYLELHARKILVRHELAHGYPELAVRLNRNFPEALRPWPQLLAALRSGDPWLTKLRWVMGAAAKATLNLAYRGRIRRMSGLLIRRWERGGGALILRRLTMGETVGTR